MEELYMPSNEGEISFVETDGGSILLEQGSQGFIQPEQGQRNTGTTIYAPHVYIIQNAPIMPRQAETQFIYQNLSSPQIPLSLIQGKSGTTVIQNIQTGPTCNAEYSTQDVPVRHIVQVVQQQPTMQLSNSQVIQYPVQQQVLHSNHITMAQQPITYTAAIPKGPPDLNGKVHILRQPLAIANIPGIGQRAGLRFNTPSAIRYSFQPSRAPRQFLQQVQQHSQNIVPVTHQQVLQDTQISASVAQPQSVLQSAQTSCARPEFTSSFQETFEKQQLGRAAISQRGGRGKRSYVAQRQKLSQKLNEQQRSSQEASKQVPQINYVQKNSNIISSTPQKIGSNYIMSASQQMGNSVTSVGGIASPAHLQQKLSTITTPALLQHKGSNLTSAYSQTNSSTVISSSHSQPKCSTTVLSAHSQLNISNISLPHSLQKGNNFASPIHPKQKVANNASTTTAQQGQSQDVHSISAFVRCNSDSSYSLSIPEDDAASTSTTIPITVESVESTQDNNSSAALIKQKVPAKKVLSLEQYKARNPLILSPTKADKNDSVEMKPPMTSIVQHKLMVVNDPKTNKKYYIPANRIMVSGALQQSTSILKEAHKADLVCNSQIKEDNTTEIVSTLSVLDASGQTSNIHLGQETLIVCQHCGIESEALMFCTNCKHPLKQGPHVVTARKLPTSEITTSVSSTNKLSEESLVSKQEFYGKNVVTKVIFTEKKLPSNAYASNKSKSARGRGRGKLKTYEEPEILTLSSDDDDDHSKSSTLSGSSNIIDQIHGLKQLSLPMSTQISSKEPNMSADMEDLLDSAANTFIYLGENNQGVDKIYSPVSIDCRSVRIGSYKHAPENGESVEILKNGYIRFKVPSCQGNSDGNLTASDRTMVTLTIQFVHMARILFHHGNSIPVIFIYLRPTEARNISKLLDLNESLHKFDPTGEECQKRITLLLKRLDEDMKTVLRSYLDIHTINKVTGKTSKLTYEINQDDANEILVKSSVPEALPYIRKAIASSQVETKTYLIFPPPPNKGGITITEDDYGCLEEEQFLNDVILDFYLKWLLLNKLTPQNRERTHIFSTFFYKRLTSKPRKVKASSSSEDNPDLTPAQKRHARVKSWTKNVDIFEKDFILIPINEHSHWFLAVICFPGLSGPVSINDGQPVQNESDQQNNRKAKIKTKAEIPSVEEGEWSDRDEAEGDDDELEDEEDEEENKEKEQKKLSNLSRETDLDKNEDADSDQVMPAQEEVATYHFKIPDNQTIHPKEKTVKSKTAPGLAIKQPCILIFDSLAGASRHRIVATLRDYLSVEYFEKKKVKKDFSKDIMKGACPKVPQQTNFSDCGIFTLQFAESFFEKPIQNFKLPIKTLLDWFPQELVACKRESIAKLIKSLMDQFKPNHGITLRAIKLNQQPNKVDASEEEETIEETKEATTALNEEQKEIESRDINVLTKRKLETEKLSAHSEMLINTNNGFPSKSRKINLNSNARDIIKVTQPSGSLIVQKTLVNPKNIDYNVSKVISSPVTNFCDSKSVRVAVVPKRTRAEIFKQPSGLNANKVELFVHKEVDQTSCSNANETVTKIREIRDEDTSEVLLILNDPVSSSANEDSIEMNTMSSESDNAQISTSICVTDPDYKNSSINLVQEANPPAISFPFGTVSSASSRSYSDKTNVSFTASSTDNAFDKLLQSTNQSQSFPSSVNASSMIIVSQPKYIQCSSYITLNSNDPQLIYSRAPVVIQKDNLKQIASCTLPGRFTSTLQTSKIIGSNLVNVPSSYGSTQTYSNNVATNATIKFLPTTVVDSSKNAFQKLASSSNDYSGSHSSKISEISTCYGNASSCAPTQTSTCTMASKMLCKVSSTPSTLAPVATQPSFNITYQDSRSKYVSDSKNVINHTSFATFPTTAKILLTSRQDNNKCNHNFSFSNIVNESNSVNSTSVTAALSEPKLTTVTRSLMDGPMISPDPQEKSTKIIVTQQNLPIFTSLNSKTSGNNISSISEKCFYVQSQSQQVATVSSNNLFSNSISTASPYSQSQSVATESSNNLFSNSISTASSYSQSQPVATESSNNLFSNSVSTASSYSQSQQVATESSKNLFSNSISAASSYSQSQQVATESSNNLFSNPIPLASTYSQSQHSDSNLCSGPFSQHSSSSYDQFNSSVSQRLSDSELLLSFASQSSVLSPTINIPTASAISSSGEFCFGPPVVSNSSTFTTPHSESQQQHSMVQRSPSSAGLGTPTKNVPSSYHSLPPASQVDVVTRQNSSVYQPITSNSQSQFGHQLASTKSIHNSCIQNSNNLTKPRNTISQLKPLPSSHVSSSSNATKSHRKSRAPSRTTSKSPSNKTTLASSCHNTSSVSSTNKTFVALSKLDNVSGHQTPSTNLITSQSFNSGIKHSITMLTPTKKINFPSSLESQSKSKTRTHVSKSFLADESSHIHTSKPSQTLSFNLQTSGNSPPHRSSISQVISSIDSQSSKCSLNSPTSNSHDLSMVSPSISTDQLPSRLNKCLVSTQSSLSVSTVALSAAPTSYAQFISSNKATQVSAPSNAALSTIESSCMFEQPVTQCTTPSADNSLSLLKSSVKSSVTNQHPNSLSSLTAPPSDIESSSSATSSFKSHISLNSAGQSFRKSNIPVSPSHSITSNNAESPSQSSVKSMPFKSSMDSNFLNQEECNPQSSTINKNYSEESISHSTLPTNFKQTYASAPPSPPPFYIPATRTSSGRNVSIPKRFLDSEQEQFFNQNKKREKPVTPRGIKCTKKSKKNSPLSFD